MVITMVQETENEKKFYFEDNKFVILEIKEYLIKDYEMDTIIELVKALKVILDEDGKAISFATKGRFEPGQTIAQMMQVMARTVAAKEIKNAICVR